MDKRLDAVADLAAIHTWLPTVGVDPARAALYGGSYGGYLVLAGLAFQPGRWAAGVDIVGVSSLVTFLRNTSPYRRAYREKCEYGRLRPPTSERPRGSVTGGNRIGDVRAPLFVIHGANDPRVPLSEAEQIAQAVRPRGLECELIVYPDEGHGLAKRATASTPTRRRPPSSARTCPGSPRFEDFDQAAGNLRSGDWGSDVSARSRRTPCSCPMPNL